jgi:DNA-binding NtrC family response regulator
MSQMMHTMVVDDEETICVALSAWLTKEGYKVETALSGPEALAMMDQKQCDLYLVDFKMPGMDGLQLLAEIRKRQPDAAIIMITAHGSIQSAVEAMKRGAIDYLCKPFDPEELSMLMERQGRFNNRKHRFPTNGMSPGTPPGGGLWANPRRSGWC